MGIVTVFSMSPFCTLASSAHLSNPHIQFSVKITGAVVVGVDAYVMTQWMDKYPATSVRFSLVVPQAVKSFLPKCNFPEFSFSSWLCQSTSSYVTPARSCTLLVRRTAVPPGIPAQTRQLPTTFLSSLSPHTPFH